MLGEYQDNQDNDGGISSNQQEQEAGGPLTPDTWHNSSLFLKTALDQRSASLLHP